MHCYFCTFTPSWNSKLGLWTVIYCYASVQYFLHVAHIAACSPVWGLWSSAYESNEENLQVYKN